MAYGKIKADTLVYDNSGSDTEVTIASLGSKVDANNPTFTGTVTIPTPAANDNTTKAASTAYVQTELSDYAALAGATFTGNVVMSGDLTVNGTTTTINSTTLAVDDKNIVLGDVSSPSDSTANGGGITLKGATDKTITWTDATDTWDFNQDIKIISSASTPTLFIGDANRTGDGQHLAEFQGHWDGTQVARLVFQAGDDTTNKDNGQIVLYTAAAGTTIEALRIHEDQSAVFTGTVSDSKGDLRSIPMNTQSSAYVLVAADAGKAVSISSGGVTVNNSIFSAGDAVTIINNSGSDQTITQGSGVTIYNSADASTGNRTLAARGMATIWFRSAAAAYISGAGLS